MTKTILITGATDGIGLETAKKLAAEGHSLLLHGRNPQKLEHARAQVASMEGAGGTFVADLSQLADVTSLASRIRERHDHLDVVINNAGVYKTPDPIAAGGLDVRFVVNTLAPYVLTRELLPLMTSNGRVINLSSAAQAAVDPAAMAGRARIGDMEAYAQSKLAITMWSRALADQRTDGPIIVAVNPGSLLASKMVKEGFGVAGNDLGIGADILTRAALSEEFADANGKYFDNDSGRFAPPHRDAVDPRKCQELVQQLDAILSEHAA
ncbi:MAG: SDR family NAD(P)-dependent oxidoreductase [Pseudomonadota bacterium]